MERHDAELVPASGSPLDAQADLSGGNFSPPFQPSKLDPAESDVAGALRDSTHGSPS